MSPKKIDNKTDNKKTHTAMLGVGFDAADGHVRITRGNNFAVVGGCEETHSVMSETVIKVNEKLYRRGRDLEHVELNELRDLILESIDDVGVARTERN
ncbi:MAG: hypothetical protein LBU65_13330 [Planctomycetaceae bacterium]|jgi:hypothetical protein|nr:hypothetical protein [Planctomycetaceae bacterium]